MLEWRSQPSKKEERAQGREGVTGMCVTERGNSPTIEISISTWSPL